MQRNNIEIARKLRKNQTDAERKLWSILRNRQLCGVKFRRQFPIGRYVLDFYSPECKLDIEVDGGQHYEDKGKKQDGLRTKELNVYGIRTLRFSDLEVLNNRDGVCAIIQELIESRISKTPHLSPLPKGERRGTEEK